MDLRIYPYETIATMNEPEAITIATNATVLTIAGSDPSGGAGMQADLKTFQQMGCYGMSVVTLLTVQNTESVERVELMSVELIQKQFRAAVADIPPRMIKTGALGSEEIIRAVAQLIRDAEIPVVVDPVLVSKHGHRLADDDAMEAYIGELMPLANIFTPNRFEAEAILNRKLDSLQSCADAAAKLQSLGPQVVLLKAGEFDGQHHHMIATGNEQVMGLSLESLQSKDTHGAGCVLSAAIAARLSLTVEDEVTLPLMEEAMRFAATSVHHAIEFAPELGQGIGPVEIRVIRE
ncbi:MAG: bifunctional hydroxymethylpyrimidine kinase/phosphomethylpyrimidine kinase [Planctomycetota bacterium]